MRKHQQRQILELLETIKEAQAVGLYADCQDGALVVGEFIEDIEGEDTETVALLEEYCELLFKASNGELHGKALNKHLIKVENSIKSELKPNRTEMVFLSYKASMSDSIESIYLAAKEDPSCDAYWIPVPYYDKAADGTYTAMHFEGADCYGADIECTDWREYDIEARHPDVIFTFNPYDDANTVTSVHPNFYCKRLRNLTECLVYVPYFVAIGENIMEDFAKIPGCMYAHKVIVQSESVREAYIKSYTETFGHSFGDPKVKFVALGSPKFDKVINSKREDFELPEEWANVIAGKKIILYNISIGAMLAGYEQYLKKLHHVLDTFKARDDVVLWWRPHPLIESTLATMRPMYLAEYEQMVLEYKQGGWGIYDDTPDVNRAIAWSDAYYGDKSSLVPLYQATGKPLMLQNKEMDDDTQQTPLADTYLLFGHFLENGDDIWFSSWVMDALFKTDRKTWMTQYIGSFLNETTDAYTGTLYLNAVQSGCCLYFAPYFSKEIAMFDIQDGVFRKIPYDNTATPEGKGAFYDVVKYGKYLFFTPMYYPAIMRMDTETFEIEYFLDWLTKLKAADGSKEDIFFRRPCLVNENTLVLAACPTNKVVEINLDTMKSTIYEVGSVDNRWHSICYDGESCWLLSVDSDKIVKWNPSVGITNEVSISREYTEGRKDCWHIISFFRGFVWLLPKQGNIAVKIDVLDGVVSIADGFRTEQIEKETQDELTYCYVQYTDTAIYAVERQSRNLITYDGNKYEKNKITLTDDSEARLGEILARDTIEHARYNGDKSNNVLYESGAAFLDHFASYAADSGVGASADRSCTEKPGRSGAHGLSADEPAGSAIYNYCKEFINQ